MAASDEETLESLLMKATSPLVHEVNWSMVTLFSERIKRSPSLAPTAIRLLAHKIQSPVQKEASYALVTLEECAKVCGAPFHIELGKFRFLNEMIKIVSPKYLGSQTSEEVKDKCIEILYNWTKELRHESKIQEAYDMLKTQGIVKSDPLTHEQKFPERKPDLLFKDEQSSKTLEMLLKSKHPDDLQAANRLIKLMVRQDIETTEKKCARQTKLDTIDNNVEVLTQMMSHHRVNQGTLTEKDVMAELYQNLENERPKLFRLASEFEATDQIKDILETNDRVMTLMNDYRKLFPEPVSSVSSNIPIVNKSESLLKFSPTSTSEMKTQKSSYEELSDIFNTDYTVTNLNSSALLMNSPDKSNDLLSEKPAPPSEPSSNLRASSDSFCLLSDDSALLGSAKNNTSILLDSNKTPTVSAAFLLSGNTTTTASTNNALPSLGGSVVQQFAAVGQRTDGQPVLVELPVKQSAYQNSLDQLDLLGQELLQQSLSKNQDSKNPETLPLTNIEVDMDSIEPAAESPIHVYSSPDQQITVDIYLCLNKPRPDIRVFALSIRSTHRHSKVTDVKFEIKVCKNQVLKLQPANQNYLPAYNPIFPSKTISQVLLLANPHKDTVKLEYNFSYLIGKSSFIHSSSIQL